MATGFDYIFLAMDFANGLVGGLIGEEEGGSVAVMTITSGF